MWVACGATRPAFLSGFQEIRRNDAVMPQCVSGERAFEC